MTARDGRYAERAALMKINKLVLLRQSRLQPRVAIPHLNQLAAKPDKLQCVYIGVYNYKAQHTYYFSSNTALQQINPLDA